MRCRNGGTKGQPCATAQTSVAEGGSSVRGPREGCGLVNANRGIS